jgi:hypothetical protein
MESSLKGRINRVEKGCQAVRREGELSTTVNRCTIQVVKVGATHIAQFNPLEILPNPFIRIDTNLHSKRPF